MPHDQTEVMTLGTRMGRKGLRCYSGWYNCTQAMLQNLLVAGVRILRWDTQMNCCWSKRRQCFPERPEKLFLCLLQRLRRLSKVMLERQLHLVFVLKTYKILTFYWKQLNVHLNLPSRFMNCLLKFICIFDLADYPITARVDSVQQQDLAILLNLHSTLKRFIFFDKETDRLSPTNKNGRRCDASSLFAYLEILLYIIVTRKGPWRYTNSNLNKQWPKLHANYKVDLWGIDVEGLKVAWM